MWFDETGTAYVSLVPNLSTCASTGIPAVPEGMPVGYLPVVCKLVNGIWVKTASTGVFQDSYGPGHWVAQLTGSTTQDGTPPTTLTVATGNGVFTVNDVTAFAFAPAQP